jgi:DNA-binding transcriptional LysR family regulator
MPFCRTRTTLGANPSLSPAGKTRLHAVQLLRTVALAQQAAHELQPSAGGALCIAAALSICTCFLPDVMEEFEAANQEEVVNLRSRKFERIVERKAGLGFGPQIALTPELDLSEANCSPSKSRALSPCDATST